MAYVTGFDHDVFVSYATVDDIPSKNGWVAAFVQHLREELNSAFGVRAEGRMWWDGSHIDGEENLPKHIRSGVQKSACLVVILSQGYVKSNWCRAEREAFFRATHVKSHPEGRIFLIDIGNLPFTEKPVEFRELRGRYFWQQDTVAAEEGHRIRIGHPVPNVDNPEHRTFFSEVKRMAAGIAKRTRRRCCLASVYGSSCVSADQFVGG